MASPSSISCGFSLLCDIGQHRVGAAEGHHRHLAEEQRDLAKGVGRPKADQDCRDRRQPQREPHQADAQRSRRIGAGVLGRLVAERAVGIGIFLGPMFAAGKFRPAALGADIADDPGRDDDDRERHREEEDRDKGYRCQRQHDVVAQRALADAHQRLDHDREHRGLQPEEQRLDIPDLAEGGVDDAQRHDGDDAGEDEETARHDAAGGAVHQPADIGRELLRLGARQQHAVVERMQKPALGNPALLLDQDAVHDRDLSGRAAKTQQRHPQPDPERLAEADAVTGISLRCDLIGRHVAHDLIMTWPCRPASCGSRRWRRGTSDKARHRASCRR
jgi:hypothetical protein